MKMEENRNVLLALTRNIFLHVPNHTGLTFHAVAAVGITISENVSETTARALLWDFVSFDECKNVLLMNASCTFFIFIDFQVNPLPQKMCLASSLEQHFCFTPASQTFKMLLWLMTFCKTLLRMHVFYSN